MKQCLEVTFTQREHAELLTREIESTPLVSGCVAGPTLASLISAGTELNFGYQGENFTTCSGYASVFRIEEVGADVANFKVGDVALAMGHHSSHQQHLADEIWLVPRGLSAADATFARLMSVTMSTLTTTKARPPDKVVVAGLGPVGHLAAQIFQSCGYRVMGCDPSPTKCELAEQGGIQYVRPQLPTENAEWRDQTSLVLECSGHEQAALDACHIVKKRGEVVLVGVPWRRRSELSAHELLHAVFHRYVVLRSGWEWEIPREETNFVDGNIRANIEAALRWLNEGRVCVSDLYTTYDARDCQNAYQALLHAQEKKLAIVFDWTKLS